jgi:hypothetical protein
LKPLRAFAILGLVLPAFAQYASPAILSRGEAPAGMSEVPNGFNFSVELTAEYTNSVFGVPAQNAQGQLPNPSALGGGVTLTISESHNWEETHLDLNYTGTFRDFAQTTSYSGLSQGLSFSASHLFSPHVALTVKERAGMFLRSLPSADSTDSSASAGPSPSDTPTTDFFNNRTIYSTTQANLTLQESDRLSFEVGGGYIFNELQSPALYGVQGQSATGDVQYRFSPHVTIGANYTFYHFGYTHGLGGAYIHAAAFTTSYRMSPSAELSFFVGPSRMESSFEQEVPIDPAFLAILCPPADRVACPFRDGTVISHSIWWGPRFGARLSRSFQHGTVYVNAAESVTPGNGLFLTSRTTTASVGYGYSILRDWSLNVSATYMSALSLGNATGHYEGLTGSCRLSRHIAGALSFVSSFNAMRYQSESIAAYDRLIYTASVGFAFSSRNSPMQFF